MYVGRHVTVLVKTAKFRALPCDNVMKLHVEI